MNYTRNQIVHAFNRVFDPIVERLDEGHELDRMFDGGEFSDHAYDEAYRDAYEHCMLVVAQAFGVTVGVVEGFLAEQNQLEFRHWWD